MRSLVCFVFAGAVLWPQWSTAEVQPHRAEYTLRLGAAANAPRIGTAVHDLTQDCAGWHLKRDITTEIALTTSWKISLVVQARQRGDGRQRLPLPRRADSERQSARDQRPGPARRAARCAPRSSSPSGPAQFALPPPTLMPVAAIDHLIERLQAKAASFPALMFDAEVIGDVFLIDVTEQNPGAVRAARPADRPVAMPTGKSWPVFMNFTRGRQQDQKPLFTVNALVFDNGVLDRLTVETGLVTVTADLQSLEMHKPPVCPRS